MVQVVRFRPRIRPLGASDLKIVFFVYSDCIKQVISFLGSKNKNLVKFSKKWGIDEA